MTTAIFVQNNMVERLTAPVARYAHKNNITLLDRSSNNDLHINNCSIDWSEYDPVIVYGSVQFVKKAKQSSLAEYVYHNDIAFSSDLWEYTFQNELLNCDGYVSLVSKVQFEGSMHIRPLQDDKAFTAKVFTQLEWNSLELDPKLQCWVSSVKEIKAEWRCWFIGGQLVEASQYRENSAMKVVQGCPQNVSNFAQDVANHWLPAECVVMDIASTSDGLKIVEFNPIHCSGWYAADVGKILDKWIEWETK